MKITLIRRRVMLSIGITLSVVLLASSAQAILETTCPTACKSNLFVRDTYGFVSAFDQIGPILGSLQKGKKGHVLRIEATASVLSHAAGIMDCNLSVNNQSIEAGALFGIDHGVTCVNGGMCLFSASYWLDLDAAELASPGQFVNQPLDVAFVCSSYANSGQRYGATMSVDMVKRK